jgi:LmbE family N-acetylglucosaminyl deacetylase
MKSLFISPHYDDAVFSTGRLIAVMEQPTVLTIFGGVPKNKDVCTAYDQKSGFNSAEEAVLARREEDAAALAVLGAEQFWLDYPENQYGETRNLQAITKELAKFAADYDEVYIPLGLTHEDHEAVAVMCGTIVDDSKDFWVYMDLPYYVDQPEVAVDKLRTMEGLEYVYRGGELGKKMTAVACYKSQAPITNLYHLMADERYYAIPR